MNVPSESVIFHLKQQIAQLSYENALLKAQVDVLSQQNTEEENAKQK